MKIYFKFIQGNFSKHSILNANMNCIYKKNFDLDRNVIYINKHFKTRKKLMLFCKA